MIRNRLTTSRPRKGLTLSELVIAVAIAVAATAGVAQLVYQATGQYRVMSRQQIVAQEAANIMEDLMSRPWNEIAGDEQVSAELSPLCRQAVPGAQLQLKIVPDDSQEDVRRITVEIDWASNAAGRAQPIRLVAWRYRNREVTP